MNVRVDTAALAAAAGQLSASGQSHAPVVAQPPGVDATSVAAVGQLNTGSAALAALLDHGSALRTVGGLAVANTATFLEGQDDANATAISSGNSPDSANGLASLPTVPQPQVPAIPALPPTAPDMPGEAHARALHGGPGTQSLYAFADHWSSMSGQLRELSATVSSTAHAIDDSWEDGTQQAGANTRKHAQWVSDMADHANAMARHARDVAAEFEAARANTPSPEEFARSRENLAAAMRRFAASRGTNAVEVQQWTQDLATKQAQATSSAMDYHAGVTAATWQSTNSTFKTAPAIATGGGPDDTIVGPHQGPHVQLVDNNNGVKFSDDPGKAPQIGPFPVPPEIAKAAENMPLVPPDNPLNRTLLPTMPAPFTIPDGAQKFYDELTAIINQHGPADAALEEARQARQIAEQALHQGCSTLAWTGNSLAFVGASGAFLLTLPVDWTPPGIAAALATGTAALGSGAVLADCFAK